VKERERERERASEGKRDREGREREVTTTTVAANKASRRIMPRTERKREKISRIQFWHFSPLGPGLSLSYANEPSLSLLQILTD
jgi:hypothetical protein